MFIKKIIPILVFINLAFAQNLQLHYETASERRYVVSTLEMFKPDEYGSTFWFVDMEYDAPGTRGVSLAYWEIARYFSLPVNNLSFTLQYNDGVANFGSLGKVWLVGLNYYLDLGFAAFPVDILYCSRPGAVSPDFQITTSWFIPVLDGSVELAGFLDLWSQDNAAGGKILVLQSEPQIWYILGEHLAVGSEVEVSHNFIYGKPGLQALPTLGLRWNF